MFEDIYGLPKIPSSLGRLNDKFLSVTYRNVHANFHYVYYANVH